jgi:hypothetical protein
MRLLSLALLPWLVTGCFRDFGTRVSPLPAPPEIAVDSELSADCFICHTEIAEHIEGDLHFKAGLHCVVCHGRSRAHLTQEDEGALPDIVFRRWRPEDDRYQWRVEQASLRLAGFCASCHASEGTDAVGYQDLEKISWSAYLKSRHGRAVSRDSRDAPSCTDCHWIHRIGVQNWDTAGVVNQCTACHGDQEMMLRVDVDPNLFDEFRNDRHANMAQVPVGEELSCVTCHDPHGLNETEYSRQYPLMD